MAKMDATLQASPIQPTTSFPMNERQACLQLSDNESHQPREQAPEQHRFPPAESRAEPVSDRNGTTAQCFQNFAVESDAAQGCKEHAYKVNPGQDRTPQWFNLEFEGVTVLEPQKSNTVGDGVHTAAFKPVRR
jgi:hypothetical protein